MKGGRRGLVDKGRSCCRGVQKAVWGWCWGCWSDALVGKKWDSVGSSVKVLVSDEEAFGLKRGA